MKHRFALVAGSVVGLSVAAGCDGGGGEGVEHVTFWQHVAPIYMENCVGCHQAGGIAPFALDTYESAKLHAAAAAQATSDRIMPPWLVTEDGSCGEFRYSRTLPAEDIDTIARWVADGALEGEPRSDLQPPGIPHLKDALELVTPEYTPEVIGGPIIPNDEYRCFVLDPELQADAFLTAYDVIPGNDALVHHVLGFTADPDADAGGMSNADAIRMLDEESPGAGWPCHFGVGLALSNSPITWAPGQGVTEFPAGTGMRVSAGDLVIVQVHYNLVDESLRGLSDQSAVRLRLVESVEREAFVVQADNFLGTVANPTPDSLPPRQESVVVTWDEPLAGIFAGMGVDSMEVHGVFPHMHALGVKQRIELRREADATCLADVQRWDWHWQLFYFYQQPIRMSASDTLHVTCEYDTRSQSEPVLAGFGSQNEMCFLALYLVP